MSKAGTKVHYIGSGLYTPEIFAEEAKKFGVSRGFPIKTAMGLGFGDKVLLAEDLGDARANLFGGFTITGFTPLNITEEQRKKLFSILKVKDDKEKNNKTAPVSVRRMCGTYTEISRVDVNYDINSLKDCLKALQIVCPESKMLLNGVYFDIEPLEYYPICHSRTITYADNLDISSVKIKGKTETKAQIVNVGQYSKK